MKCKIFSGSIFIHFWGGKGGGDEEGPYGISQSVFPVPRALLFDSATSQSVLRQVPAQIYISPS